MSEKTYRVLVLILLVVLVLVVGTSTVMTYQANKASRDLAAQDAARVEQCKLAIQNAQLDVLQENSLELYPFNTGSDYQIALTHFFQYEALMAQNKILAGCLP